MTLLQVLMKERVPKNRKADVKFANKAGDSSVELRVLSGGCLCLRCRGHSEIEASLLKNDSLIAHAPGHAFAVEVLEQRDRVLAAHARQFLELAYIDLG